MGYNLIMFLSGIQQNIIAIVVPIVVLQYAFALFCLLKLAYFDLSRKQYIIWNVIILFAFFIGGAVFLIYYYKHPDKRVPKTPVLPEDTGVEPLPDKNGESPVTQEPFDASILHDADNDTEKRDGAINGNKADDGQNK